MGELALGWSSAEFAEEHLFCGIDATGQRTKSTRHQVVGPCRIEDGTAYAHNGVALERNTASGIPTSGRFHETQRTSPTQFAAVNMVRERTADLGNNPWPLAIGSAVIAGMLSLFITFLRSYNQTTLIRAASARSSAI